MMSSNKKMDLDELLDSLTKTETVPKFPLSMYYTEGAKYLNLYQYNKALKYLNEALAINPTSINSILKRSKCLMCLRQYKEALEDANQVLKLSPDNVHAIHLKGQVQYLMGDFEGGYLTYLHGWKAKPANNELRMGKQLCEDALKNLHPGPGTKIREEDAAEISKAGEDKKKFEERLRYRRSTRECFSEDIRFLEELMKDENLTSVHGICRETVDFIKGREKFWCMETPMHSRKRRQKIITKEIKKTSVSDKQLKFCKAAKRRALIELSKGRVVDCISEARKLLNIAESFPRRKETEKMTLICDAYHLLSLAHKDEQNFHLAYKYLNQELRVAYEFDLMLPKMRGYHRLGEIYQLFDDVKRSLKCFRWLITAMSPENVEKLKELPPDEFVQMQQVVEWMNSITSGVRLSLRESIISPVIDAFNEYFPLFSEEDSTSFGEEGSKDETEELDQSDLEILEELIEHGRDESMDDSRESKKEITEKSDEVVKSKSVGNLPRKQVESSSDDSDIPEEIENEDFEEGDDIGKFEQDLSGLAKKKSFNSSPDDDIVDSDNLSREPNKESSERSLITEKDAELESDSLGGVEELDESNRIKQVEDSKDESKRIEESKESTSLSRVPKQRKFA